MRRLRFDLFLAGLVCLVACTTVLKPQRCSAAIADSLDDWSASGVQGQNNWFNGYYNLTTDPDGTYGVADFIVFSNDGSGTISATNQWNGSMWQLAPNPVGTGGPWTALGSNLAIPNGTNSTPNEEHWPIRRWQSTVSQQVRITTLLNNIESAGTGATNLLLINGAEVDSYAASFPTPASRFIDTMLNVGDIVDLALTPAGIGGDRLDIGDASFNRLTIDVVPTPEAGPGENQTIPAPGALLLGTLGAGFVGWLKRHRVV